MVEVAKATLRTYYQGCDRHDSQHRYTRAGTSSIISENTQISDTLLAMDRVNGHESRVAVADRLVRKQIFAMWPTRARISGIFEPEEMIRLFGIEAAEMTAQEEMLTGTFDAGDLRECQVVRAWVTVPLATELAIRTKETHVGDVHGASFHSTTVLGSNVYSYLNQGRLVSENKQSDPIPQVWSP